MSSEMAYEEHPYHPKDAIGRASRTMMVTAGAGTFVSAIQNTLQKQNYGPMGIFTRSGTTIAIFAGLGGAYEFARSASANLRQKDDTWNEAIGGFFGGSIIGLRVRSMPAVLGYGVGLAVILSTFDFCGHALTGYRKDPSEDRYARKQSLRANYRTPAEDTIATIGEGRGIYPTGYEERRRQRLKERYGYEITAPPSH